jgi:hypothetical protein
MLLNNLKIGTRLGLGFAVVLILLVLVILTGFWGIKSTSRVTLGMLNVDAQIADNFAIARAIALELRRYEKNIFIRIGSKDERAKKDEVSCQQWTLASQAAAERISISVDIEKKKSDRMASFRRLKRPSNRRYAATPFANLVRRCILSSIL